MTRTKRFRPRIEVLEGREIPATFNWVGGAATTLDNGVRWSNVNNWRLNGQIPAAVPGAGDFVVIDANSTQDLWVGSANSPATHRTVEGIQYLGQGDTNLVVGEGGSLTLAGGQSDWNWTDANGQGDMGRIVLRDGAHLNIVDGAVLTSTFLLTQHQASPSPVTPEVNVNNGGHLDIAQGSIVATINVGTAGTANAWLSVGQAAAGGNLRMADTGAVLNIGSLGQLILDQEQSQSTSGGIYADGAGTVEFNVSGGGSILRTGVGTDNAGVQLDGKLNLTTGSELSIDAGSVLQVGGTPGDSVGVRLDVNCKLNLTAGSELIIPNKNLEIRQNSYLRVHGPADAYVSVGSGTVVFYYAYLEFLDSYGLASLSVAGHMTSIMSDFYFTADGSVNGRCDHVGVSGVYTVLGDSSQRTLCRLQVINATPDVSWEYDVFRNGNDIAFANVNSSLQALAYGQVAGLIAYLEITNDGTDATIKFSPEPGGEEEEG